MKKVEVYKAEPMMDEKCGLIYSAPQSGPEKNEYYVFELARSQEKVI